MGWSMFETLMFAAIWILPYVNPYKADYAESFNFDELQNVLYNIDIAQDPLMILDNNVIQDSTAELHELLKFIYLKNRHGQLYRCSIPSLKENISDQQIDDEAEALSIGIKDLLKPLENGPCLFKTKSWWTYEICYGKFIKQYHLQDNKKEGDTLVLGYLQSEYDWTEDEKSFSEKPGSRRPPSEQRFHHQAYTNGTKCDLTGEPRGAQLKVFCEEGAVDYIARVDEPQTCQYTITVHTPNLSRHPLLKPVQRPKPRSIMCQPVLDAEQFGVYEAAKARKEAAAAKKRKMAEAKKKEETSLQDTTQSDVPDTDDSGIDLSVQVVGIGNGGLENLLESLLPKNKKPDVKGHGDEEYASLDELKHVKDLKTADHDKVIDSLKRHLSKIEKMELATRTEMVEAAKATGEFRKALTRLIQSATKEKTSLPSSDLAHVTKLAVYIAQLSDLLTRVNPVLERLQDKEQELLDRVREHIDDGERAAAHPEAAVYVDTSEARDLIGTLREMQRHLADTLTDNLEGYHDLVEELDDLEDLVSVIDIDEAVHDKSVDDGNSKTEEPDATRSRTVPSGGGEPDRISSGSGDATGTDSAHSGSGDAVPKGSGSGDATGTDSAHSGSGDAVPKGSGSGDATGTDSAHSGSGDAVRTGSRHVDGRVGGDTTAKKPGSEVEVSDAGAGGSGSGDNVDKHTGSASTNAKDAPPEGPEGKRVFKELVRKDVDTAMEENIRNTLKAVGINPGDQHIHVKILTPFGRDDAKMSDEKKRQFENLIVTVLTHQQDHLADAEQQQRLEDAYDFSLDGFISTAAASQQEPEAREPESGATTPREPFAYIREEDDAGASNMFNIAQLVTIHNVEVGDEEKADSKRGQGSQGAQEDDEGEVRVKTTY